MLCVGWSTGTVVTYISHKVVASLYKSQNIDKTKFKTYFTCGEIDKTFLPTIKKEVKMEVNNDECYDRIVCKNDDIKEGQFKEIKLDDEGKVSGILIKQNGKLSALGNKCTHYGANLATSGSLGEGIIRCPWHGACFNISSGDIEVTYLFIIDILERLKHLSQKNITFGVLIVSLLFLTFEGLSGFGFFGKV